MCFIITEYAEVYRAKIRRARKDHRCDECGRMILSGDQYYYGSGIFEGSAFDIKNCFLCHFDRKRIYDAERAEGCPHHESICPEGELYESLAARGWDYTKSLVDVPMSFQLTGMDEWDKAKTLQGNDL